MAYSETFYEFYPKRAPDGQELVSVREADWKLVTRPGREELYDLAADPHELADVAAEHADRVAKLRDALDVLAGSWPAQPRPWQLELTDDEAAEHDEACAHSAMSSSPPPANGRSSSPARAH